MKKIVGLIAGLTLLTAACGGDEVSSQPTTPAVEIAHSIISISPTATEMLYAIGAGEQVLAVDDYSNFPAEAAEKMQGISGFEPNVEALAALEPDLIVTDGTNPDFLAQLDTLGIAHWEGPAAVAMDDIYEQLEQLGVVTGHSDEAGVLVADMKASVEVVIAALPALTEPLSYYHELDPTYFSVTSATFIGLVYSLAGLENIADAAVDAGPYPQLTAEFILAADPDLVFLACTKYCGETAETLAARPGWESLSAVVNENVIGLDDDVASRWGPRVVEYIEQIGAAVSAAAKKVAG